MTKAELTEVVAKTVDLPTKGAAAVVDAIFDGVVRALNAGDRVELRGVGSFGTRERRSRVGRNPKTGTLVDVPTKRVAYFKPSKELLRIINAEAPSGS